MVQFILLLQNYSRQFKMMTYFKYQLCSVSNSLIKQHLTFEDDLFPKKMYNFLVIAKLAIIESLENTMKLIAYGILIP